jgi:hypothetical protein
MIAFGELPMRIDNIPICRDDCHAPLIFHAVARGAAHRRSLPIACTFVHMFVDFPGLLHRLCIALYSAPSAACSSAAAILKIQVGTTHNHSVKPGQTPNLFIQAFFKSPNSAQYKLYFAPEHLNNQDSQARRIRMRVGVRLVVPSKSLALLYRLTASNSSIPFANS